MRTFKLGLDSVLTATSTSVNKCAHLVTLFKMHKTRVIGTLYCEDPLETECAPF